MTQPQEQPATPPPTPPTPPPPPLFVGIDVAKDKLDLARSDQPGELHTFPNTPAGIRLLVDALLQDPRPTRVVLEATGGLEEPLLEALLDASLPAARVNPRHVRHFAIALRRLAKTDAIDAALLADFGRLADPLLAVRRSANRAELDALVTCRRQLKLVQTEQNNRLASTRSPAARKAIQAVLKTLDRQVRELDEQIRQLIDGDDDFKSLDRLLQGVPGVGPGLSATLLAELPELGGTDRQHIGALVGVAPFNADSAHTQGRRTIQGGRVTVRCTLYMATLATIRVNPVIRAFSDRLKAAGKPAKVRIVACMRKLLTLLNAMARDNCPWSELQVVKCLQTP